MHKVSIPDLNMSKIRGRIFSKEGENDTNPIWQLCAIREEPFQIIQMGSKEVQKHIHVDEIHLEHDLIHVDQI